MANGRSALGLGLSASFATQFTPFLLSSPMTARTLAVEKNQVQEVKTDLLLSWVGSVIFTLVMYYLLDDPITLWGGLAFDTALSVLYWIRGGLGSTTTANTSTTVTPS